jgi:hypothetical protein
MNSWFILCLKFSINTLQLKMKVGLLSNSFKEEYDLRKFEKSIIHRYKLKKSQEEELKRLESSPINTSIRQEKLFETIKK